ncbi:hypothetical protein [Veillonella nakazawae]|uniref:hypothetical protein n=1 Tax=Veillonella nakazawae TaxID=2682456 RepID=UPI003994A9ED
MFRCTHGAVIGLWQRGISSTIIWRALWNGEDLDTALDSYVFWYTSRWVAFVTWTSQITKTGVSNFLIKPSNDLVKSALQLENNCLLR